MPRAAVGVRLPYAGGDVRLRRSAGALAVGMAGAMRRLGGSTTANGLRGPIIYELDARSWLDRLSRGAGRRVGLGDVPEIELERILASGCDLFWPMGVWRTGAAGRRVARGLDWLVREGREILPDFTIEDIIGSPYAVTDYEVSPSLGGEGGLARLRRRLERAGVGLILDYVPNHTATDHPWVRRHPERYVQVDPRLVAAEPDVAFAIRVGRRSIRIAHGRDPNFPPWTDTAQLDHRVPETRTAMADVLRQVGARCDGVRCDMAMLVLDDVFRATWQARSVPPASDAGSVSEFWWHAIATVRERFPGFLMLAEAYWDLGYRLQQLGFDGTYDKTLLDRLRSGPGEAVAAHLGADHDYQQRSIRFLENHDEPRIATTLSPARQRSAALIVATVPGMLLLHDGQLEGARIRTPVQLGRRPDEPVDADVQAFYRSLLGALRDDAVRQGTPVRLEPRAASDGDISDRAIVAWLWVGPGPALHLAVANLGVGIGRCLITLPRPELAGRTVVLEDRLSDARYVRDGDELAGVGLYLELPPDGHHLFRIAPDGGDGTRW